MEVKMSESGNLSETRLPWIAHAGRLVMLLVLCSPLIMAGPRSADAGDNRAKIRIGVGAGVLGVVIANELAKKEQEVKEPSSRKTVTPRSKSTTREAKSTKRSRAHASKAEKKIRSARASKPAKQPVEPGPANETAQPSGTAETATAKTEAAAQPAAVGKTNVPAAKTEAAAPPGADGKVNALTTGAVPNTISAPAEVTSAQEHLRYLGYDVPAATGAVDLKTKFAIMQFQESIGAPSTGALTVEQLQALFVKAAEREAKQK